MKKIYTFLAGFVLLSSLFTSCTPETALKIGEPVEPVTVPVVDSPLVSNNRSGLRHAFRELRTPEIVVNVEAGQDEIKMGQRGTMFHFYPYSFKDANGQIITDGFISIRIIEIYDLGQMIANRLLTQDNSGKLLDSRGMMYVTATKNGLPVYPTKYGIMFKQDAGSGQAVNLYQGSFTSPDSAMVWTMQAATTGNHAATTTTIGGSDYYVIDSVSTFNAWLNLAAEHTEAQPVTGVFTLSMPSTHLNLANTEVYVVYKDTKSLVTMAGYNSRVPGFLTDEQIPLGREFNIIVLAQDNNTYYYWRKDNITMSQNLVIPADPEVIDKASLLNRLNTYQ